MALNGKVKKEMLFTLQNLHQQVNLDLFLWVGISWGFSPSFKLEDILSLHQNDKQQNSNTSWVVVFNSHVWRQTLLGLVLGNWKTLLWEREGIFCLPLCTLWNAERGFSNLDIYAFPNYSGICLQTVWHTTWGDNLLFMCYTFYSHISPTLKWQRINLCFFVIQHITCVCVYSRNNVIE